MLLCRFGGTSVCLVKLEERYKICFYFEVSYVKLQNPLLKLIGTKLDEKYLQYIPFNCENKRLSVTIT